MPPEDRSGSPAGELAGLPLHEAHEIALRGIEDARQAQAAWKRMWAARVWVEVDPEGEVRRSRLSVAQELGTKQSRVSELLRDAGYPAGRTGRPKKDSENPLPTP